MRDQVIRQITYAQAICEATHQAFELDPNVFLIGQGTRGAGYIFGTLDGLFEKYGPKRVIEMPLSEAAMMGVCMGAALEGMRPILVLQRADFLLLVLDQLINHISKWHFMFAGKAKIPVVIRCIVGRGWGQGPQHSQALHSLCSHFPGLRVIFPSTAFDAKGLFLNSIFSNDPVIFFEGRPQHFQKDFVPINPYVLPFGKARILAEGNDITILNCSFLLPVAMETKNILQKKSISADVIDLISISPIDYETIKASIKKTKRLLILDTSWKTAGISSTIASEIYKTFFGQLKAPIEILTIPDYPTPTAENLEKRYYPTCQKTLETSLSMLKYNSKNTYTCQ